MGTHRRRRRQLRYRHPLLRSPDGSGKDPALLLPKAPDPVLTFRVAWNWEDVSQAAFTKLARNFGDWCEGNSDAGSPYAKLFSTFFGWRRQSGKLEMKGLSTAGAEAERLFDQHIAAISDGVGVHLPAPSEICDGAMVNHPDVDLADPQWNTSRVPWHTLYYKDNYPRLQQIKARWDPHNIFQHALSIRPA